MKKTSITITLGLCLGLSLGMGMLHSGLDWIRWFMPATRGEFPLYTVSGFWNPPWTLWLLAPLAALPDRAGLIISNLLSGILVIVSIRMMGGRDAWTSLLSLPFLWLLWLGQLDALPLTGIAIGYAATRREDNRLMVVSLALLSIKPQIGLIVALYFLVESRLWKSTLGMTFLFLLSLWIHGAWPLQLWSIRPSLNIAEQSASIYPLVGPFAFFLYLLCFIPQKNVVGRLGVLLAVNSLAFPYMKLYSLLVLVGVVASIMDRKGRVAVMLVSYLLIPQLGLPSFLLPLFCLVIILKGGRPKLNSGGDAIEKEAQMYSGVLPSLWPGRSRRGSFGSPQAGADPDMPGLPRHQI